MTGLRRGELASLIAASFDLRSSPAILTVQAGASKHRRKDVLPLHPQLVEMLRVWLQGMQTNDVLFPKLAKRRTWLMVKKDLERAGIPYKTSEGIADFHAAGRHTHITELFRNGASITEVRELARHQDVKMTMRYTHIGLEDQARALAALPNPCRRIVSTSDVFDRPKRTRGDAGRHEEVAGQDNGSANGEATSDADSQETAEGDETCPSPSEEWRRRD